MGPKTWQRSLDSDRSPSKIACYALIRPEHSLDRYRKSNLRLHLGNIIRVSSRCNSIANEDEDSKS